MIAVKREAGGRGGSESLIRDVAEGGEVPVSAPANNFALAKSRAGYLFIAGGIGITPIMAMIRQLTASGGRFKLCYCTRSPAATAFRDELSAPELRGKVKIHHDGGDLAKALDLWPVVEKPQGAPLLLRPARPDAGGARHDRATGRPRRCISRPSPRPPRRSPTTGRSRCGSRAAAAAIAVPVGKTILEALRDHGLDVPSSCESGTCGTCRTRLISGEADHRDLVLADDERATNIMVCVSRARSDEIVIDR